MHRFFFRIMDVLDWIEKAQNFSSDEFLKDFAIDIIEDEKAIDIQREQWVKDGESYKGEIIGFYKKTTEIIWEESGGKKGYKKAGEPWNLDWTSDLWHHTYLNAVIKGKDLEFEFDSNGINKAKLFETIKKHGSISNPEDIFGLFKTYQDPFIKLIEPKFVQQLNDYYV